MIALEKVAETNGNQDVHGLNITSKIFYSVKEKCDLSCRPTEAAEATKPSAGLLYRHIPLRLLSPEDLWMGTEPHPEGTQERKEQGPGPTSSRFSSKGCFHRAQTVASSQAQKNPKFVNVSYLVFFNFR